MANRFIERLRGFTDLTGEEIEALERATAATTAFAPRKDLIREGDRTGPVLVMLEGWAFRYKILPNGSRQIMAFVMPGDVCDLRVGWRAEMDHGIQAATHAQVATISREVIDDLMTRHHGIAQAMYVAQLVDEGTLRAWVVSLGRRSSLERVSHLLLELFLRAIRVSAIVDDAMELPLSQLVLADALGMTPVHINRVLQDLRRSGAIELRRGVLRISDPGMLTRISGFDDGYLHKRLR